VADLHGEHGFVGIDRTRAEIDDIIAVVGTGTVAQVKGDPEGVALPESVRIGAIGLVLDDVVMVVDIVGRDVEIVLVPREIIISGEVGVFAVFGRIFAVGQVEVIVYIDGIDANPARLEIRVPRIALGIAPAAYVRGLPRQVIAVGLHVGDIPIHGGRVFGNTAVAGIPIMPVAHQLSACGCAQCSCTDQPHINNAIHAILLIICKVRIRNGTACFT
jgi:hypothetical protein